MYETEKFWNKKMFKSTFQIQDFVVNLQISGHIWIGGGTSDEMEWVEL